MPFIEINPILCFNFHVILNSYSTRCLDVISKLRSVEYVLAIAGKMRLPILELYAVTKRF